MNKKFFPLIYLVITIVVALLAVAAVVNKISEKDQPLVNLPTNSGNQQPVVCTMEAKLCPDGSSVGRTGPKCEFALCPNSKTDQTAGWKTYTNSEYGFEIEYPESWSVSPMAKLSSGDFLSISNVVGNDGDIPNPNQAFLYIEIIPTNSKTLSAIIDDWFKTNPPTKKENIKISRIDGIKVFRSNGYDSFVIKGDKVYSFGYIQPNSFYPTKSDQSLQNTFEKVISTFKFTSQSQQ